MKIKQKIATLFGALTLAFSPAALADQVRMKVTKVMDNHGFEAPIASATSLIPADWTTEGGIKWNTIGECTRGFQPQWSAKSPDGKTTIEMLPIFGWRSNNTGTPIPPDCLRQNFSSARAFLDFLTGQLENGKVLETETDPAVGQLLQVFGYEMLGDPYTRTWADYTSALVAYDYEGTRMNAVAMILTMHTYMRSGHTFGFGAPMEMNSGSAFSITVFAAPEDEFEDALKTFQTFSVNYRANPEWQIRIAKHNSRMGEINRKGAEERLRQSAKAYSDMSESSMESWRKRQASEDRMSRETSEATFGTETYNADTTTGQIELPYGYNDVWQMPDDTFVLSNDPFFEPADGRRLSVTE